MSWRVAILGAGIGAQHVTGYAALPSDFTVATICDLDPIRGQALGALAGARHTGDLASVLADPGIDIVDICLPPHLHVPVARDALRAGKHVICEKPLAPSLAEAEALAALAQEQGRFLWPVFQYRFGPGLAALHALIDQGLAGIPHVATLETHWDRGAEYYAVPWRGTWEGEQGGAILGHAIHIHDLLCDILGPVASVHAELATRVNPIEVEDCAALSIRMASGALVTSSVTLGAAGNESRLRVVFEHLTAESGRTPYAPGQGEWRFLARDPALQGRIDAAVAGVTDRPWSYAGQFAEIAQALGGRPNRAVTAEDGCRSIAFVTGVYASARSGRPQRFPLPADHPLRDGWLPEQTATTTPR